MRPTMKMMIAVKTIALQRADYDKTFWGTLYSMSYEDASNYISKYGRKVSYARS